MQIQKPRQGYKLVKSLFGKYEEIPEDWKVTTINQLGRIVTGNTPSTENREYYGDEFLWAGPSDITDQKYVEKTETKLSRKGFELARKIPSNSILFVCIGSTIGKVSMSSKEMATNQQINSIICKDHDPSFIYYQLLFNSEKIKNMANQVAIPILNKTDFGTIKISISTQIKEQQKIALILSNVDSLIQQTQKEIEQTQRLKKGLMQRLFRKGIGHTKFKKIKIGNNPYQLSTIPDSWDYLELGSTGDFINGLNKQKEDYGHGCLHVNIDNLFEFFTIQLEKLGRVNAEEKEIERYRLEKDDICLLRSSVKRDGIGYPALFSGSIEPVVFSGFIIRFRPNPKIWNAAFLTRLLRSGFIRRNVIAWATVSANININQESYKKIPVPRPSIKEQQEIANILSNSESQIQKQQEYKLKLETLKKGLMQKLLTGQIRVKI